jgi:tetratricopeptide (TPR) repeat protein
VGTANAYNAQEEGRETMSTVLDLMETERGEDELPTSPDEVLSSYKSLVGSRRLTVSDILSYAQSFESFGLAEEAVGAYDEALMRDGLCWQAYLGRGEALLGMYVARDDGGSASDLGARAAGDFERALSLAGSARAHVFRSFATALLVIGDYARCENLVESWFGQGHEQEVDARSDLFYVLGFARLFAGCADKGIEAFLEMEKLGRSIEDSLFGRAVCFLVMRKLDLVREIQSQLGVELSEAIRILGESGCNSFLDVARVLVMIE